MAAVIYSPLKRPQVEVGAHPVETSRYLLITPIIEAFFDVACSWIESRAPGAMIYGMPRLGKTRAIQCLSRLLLERFGPSLPILTHACLDHLRPSETVFFEELLKTAGHAMWASGAATAKRYRLTEFLIEKAEQSNQNRIILFVDEAQKLLEQNYKWLVDVHNELDRQSIALIVLLVGQPELMHQFSAFQLTKKTQIIGRFMVHQFRFRGLRAKGELRACLANYDEGSEYPPASSFSFTRYFFPEAFQGGFRLENYAPTVWQAFREVREEAQLPVSTELPMQYFCRTVEYVLTRFGTLESLGRDLSLMQWKEAIQRSGYVDAERYVVDPEDTIN
jgi:hypothetical protein